MGYEIGEVISKEKDYVNVRLPKKAACGHCHGCSLSSDSNYMVTQASDTLGAKVGQKVKLEIADLSPLKYGFILYIAPLLLFLTGYLLTEWVGKRLALTTDTIQGLGIIIGFVLLALPFIGLLLVNRKKKKNQVWSIRVVELDPAVGTQEAASSAPQC
jgi:sigma-E factor negative regulatory protein RseC